jgi:hypothetical protein
MYFRSHSEYHLLCALKHSSHSLLNGALLHKSLPRPVGTLRHFQGGYLSGTPRTRVSRMLNGPETLKRVCRIASSPLHIALSGTANAVTPALSGGCGRGRVCRPPRKRRNGPISKKGGSERMPKAVFSRCRARRDTVRGEEKRLLYKAVKREREREREQETCQIYRNVWRSLVLCARDEVRRHRFHYSLFAIHRILFRVSSLPYKSKRQAKNFRVPNGVGRRFRAAARAIE